MNKLRVLIWITLFFISLNLSAQLNNGDYFLIKNQQIESEDARRLVIKIKTDSTYEFVDNKNHDYKYDKKDNEIEFPLCNNMCEFKIQGDKIVIKAQDKTYIGMPIDINNQQEKEYFRYILVDIDLPKNNEKDSTISTLEGITTMRNSQTLYLSCHQKSLYPRHDKNESCIIQFDELKTSVCDIDNRCTMSGVYNRNKDLLFKNRMKDYQLKEDFIFILFIDKDVKIKDINTTIKAIRKVENLSKIYFANQFVDKKKYEVNYISIPIDVELNDRLSLYSEWIATDIKERFIRGERIMIVDDKPETKVGGFGIVE